jgi:hypothetical protein
LIGNLTNNQTKTEENMLPETRVWTREEMMQRVALFANLKGGRTGLPDSHLPECDRELINVIGFQPPEDQDGADVVSPVGEDVSLQAAIPISEGFNMGFVKAEPGKGPLMHNHDTNETFMPIKGRWRCAWNEGDDYEFIDVGPCDVVSFPPGAIRRFECVEAPEGETEGLMLFVIGGDAPGAEFSDKAYERIDEVPAPA